MYHGVIVSAIVCARARLHPQAQGAGVGLLSHSMSAPRHADVVNVAFIAQRHKTGLSEEIHGTTCEKLQAAGGEERNCSW